MRSARLTRYALVGALNTAITFAVFSVLVLAGVGYAAALVIGYAAGLASGYTLNRRWTFAVAHEPRRQVPRYLVVQGAGLLANLAVLVALVEVARLPALAAQAVALVTVLVTTYTLNRRWTFVSTAPR